MNERMKDKLKLLVNIKYITLLAGEASAAWNKYVKELPDGGGGAYKTWSWEPDRDAWELWRRRHGVLNDSEVTGELKGYVKLEHGVADRTSVANANGRFIPAGYLLVPEELAKKALI
jgi:hypothetical protein